MKKIFFLIVGVLPLFALQAELSFRHSDDFESVGEGGAYEGEKLPEDSASGVWVRKQSDADVVVSAEDGELRFQGGQHPDSFVLWTASWSKSGESLAKGLTVEIRLKILPGGGFVLADTCGNEMPEDATLEIDEKSVKWGGKILLDNTDNGGRFHTFRIARWGGDVGYDIWRDGEPIGEREKGAGLPGDCLTFGTPQGRAGGAIIDHLRWDASGAYCP